MHLEGFFGLFMLYKNNTGKKFPEIDFWSLLLNNVYMIDTW